MWNHHTQLPGVTVTVTDLQIPGYLAGTWVIDPVHSHVGFVIKHMMVSKVRGRFGTFTGEITTAADPLHSRVTASIDATSIDTNNSMRDDHIRSADFLDVANHRTLEFVSTGVRFDDGEFFIDGDLSIRGVTRPVSLAVDTPEFGPTPQGGTKAGFSATTEIKRADFGIDFNGPIPGGGIMLADKVQIVLEIEADLQPA
jgi:polyisoprenoid-binding protein YceI